MGHGSGHVMTAPVSIPDSQAAKLWELLRRNPRFRRTERRLRELETIRQGEDSRARDRAAGSVLRILTALARWNPCAETALRWLVFPPLFIRREIACEPGREADIARGKAVVVETVRLGWGWHPQASESNPWTDFQSEHLPGSRGLHSAQSKANFHGWPLCPGPEVEAVTSYDSRLQRQCHDAIGEWTAHFADGRRFTPDSPWPDTPPGFRRTFAARWNRFCGRGHVAETDFFQDWNLASLAARATRTVKTANDLVRELVGDLDRVRRGQSETVCPPVLAGKGGSLRQVPQAGFQLSETEQQRLFLFDDLARRRVFALPHLLTREDVVPVLNELKRQLLKELPETHQLLGTPEFWSDFIAVDAITRAEAVDTGESIRRLIYRSHEMKLVLERSGLPPGLIRRHFQNDALVAPGPGASAVQRREWEKVKSRLGESIREVNQRKRPTIKRRVEFMHTMVNAVFPRLNLAVLLAKPQHKRTGKE
jgi:hypothetical protein